LLPEQLWALTSLTPEKRKKKVRTERKTPHFDNISNY